MDLAQVTKANHQHPEITYQHRQPEKSVLYQIIEQNLNTLLAEAEGQSEYGFGYPNYVKREFERYLSCGMPCAGFARIRCPDCGYERLLAFSCKARMVCPSCVARRMVETSAFLVDEVLPLAPYRQWTFTFPKHLRYLLVREGRLLSRVITTCLRVVFSWQKKQAKNLGITQPLTGSVSLLQRYGSRLQLNPHVHAWIPDGVFYLDDQGQMEFRYLAPPTPQDIEKLLYKICRRVLKRCHREIREPDMDQMALATAQASSIELPSNQPLIQEILKPSPRCAQVMGFSLHADLASEKNDRRTLERLLRYGQRPPFAQKRLSLTPFGKVRLKLRKPDYTGQTEVLFEPLDFLRRLAAIIPPPKQNQIRFHGVFAPHSQHNAAIKMLVPKSPSVNTDKLPANVSSNVSSQTDEPAKPANSRYRLLWSELLQRTFKIDVLCCPKCQGKMKLISLFKDPKVIHKICQHLGLPIELPQLSPARASPQLELLDWN